MRFDSGLNIKPLFAPLGFSYGKDCFGPEVENRTLDAIRKSLQDPDCEGPEIVYSIAMDVGKIKDKEEIVDRNLLYGVVTYEKGKLGNEPVRSQGHIHAVSSSCNSSTCEVYEIWSGSAYILMQEKAAVNPGRCFAVLANVGDVVIVPPYWAHATIVADIEKRLTFGAWCVRDYGFDYEEVRAYKGLAYFPIVNEDSSITFIKNENYGFSELIVKSPREYKEFNIEKEKSIYRQFEENPDRFLFVSNPELAEDKWINFIP